MERSSPYFRDLACQMLAYEAGGKESSEEMAEVGQRICQKLDQQMTKLIGPAGLSALTSRALYLARVEFPFLNGVSIETQEKTCLEGLRESVVGRPPTEAVSAIEAIFANFVWLLMTFIGEDLALRQVRNIWPEISPDGADGGAKEGMK